MISRFFGVLLCGTACLVMVAEMLTDYAISQNLVEAFAVASAACSGYLFAKDAK